MVSPEERNKDGNGWLVKLRRDGTDQWLLWLGFRSPVLNDLLGGRRAWPSIFFAERSTDPRAVHPFEPRMGADDRRRPAELSFMPGTQRPVTVRWEYDTKDMTIEEAAEVVVKAICV